MHQKNYFFAIWSSMYVVVMILKYNKLSVLSQLKTTFFFFWQISEKLEVSDKNSSSCLGPTLLFSSRGGGYVKSIQIITFFSYIWCFSDWMMRIFWVEIETKLLLKNAISIINFCSSIRYIDPSSDISNHWGSKYLNCMVISIGRIISTLRVLDFWQSIK